MLLEGFGVSLVCYYLVFYLLSIGVDSVSYNFLNFFTDLDWDLKFFSGLLLGV